MAAAPPKREGIVWIDEEFDRDDPNVFTARFSAEWEDEEGDFREETRELSAEEAIAWGRPRAPVVLLRLGDRAVYYSAGERNPDVETFPPLPSGGLRVERRRSPSPLRGGKYAGLRRARREGRERSEAREVARGEAPLLWWEGVGVLLTVAFGIVQAVRGEWLWPAAIAATFVGAFLFAFCRELWRRRRRLRRALPRRWHWLLIPVAFLAGLLGLLPEATRAALRGRRRRKPG